MFRLTRRHVLARSFIDMQAKRLERALVALRNQGSCEAADARLLAW
jgi:hypothetical protein